MNLTEFTTLLSHPNAVSERQVSALEKIVEEFPYFQSARALRLKGLYNQDSFKYNGELKVTAAHTTDRSVLFEYITSENFMAINKAFFAEKEARINAIKVHEIEILNPEKKEEPVKIDPLEQSILTSIREASASKPQQVEEEKAIEIPQQETKPEISEESIEEKLEIGKPLEFSSGEKHSFQEWLQLSTFKPIQREETPIESEKTANTEEISEIDSEKKKKLEIIDRFIEANPKISPVKNTTPISLISERNSQDNSYLMTETLAKVYLEQKKYQKAIQAYEILILKYPEKSHFFADRILDIKTLQQNNNN
ncbi:tetratricopeptide repeat protein [Flavobacterium lindanitolerans]|uniref:tetratricopeptide repeat protein n=1 Tax=Flavobacterium lindanitolerans TaxID=428988 RepID=UPI0027B931E2|nr:tetratricopeptide repeat protein [Flavobacterium lindanitolerans]MDQ7959708.1 tetratricopeptide repeat protein [Flavobacterium lindanitolerans]